MAQAGDRVEDPVSGATVDFVQTGLETRGELLELEVRARPRWSAGPLHLHPRQDEVVHLRAGSLRSIRDDVERSHGEGEIVRIPRGTRHTLWNDGEDETLLTIEFRPALRTAELFETVLGVGRTRRTRTRLAELLRLLWTTRGYRDEIRFARPRRADVRVFVRALRRAVARGR